MEHSTDNHSQLMLTLREQLATIYHWQTEVLQGTEMFLFGGLLGTLTVKRQQSPSDIGRAVPGHLEKLPLEGSEVALLETLFKALRERGQSDAMISKMAETTAAFMAMFVNAVLPSTAVSVNNDDPPSLDVLEAMVLGLVESAQSHNKQHAARSGRLVAPPCIVPSSSSSGQQ